MGANKALHRTAMLRWLCRADPLEALIWIGVTLVLVSEERAVLVHP